MSSREFPRSVVELLLALLQQFAVKVYLRVKTSQ